MHKQKKLNKLFSKSAFRLIGVIVLFIIFALFVSWIGEVASTKTPEVYTPKQYNAPKQALQFQQEDQQHTEISLAFDQQSKTKSGSDQKSVVFTKVRSNDESKKGRTYNFFGLSLIFIGVGVVIAMAMYYQQASGKQSTFEIESTKR